MILAGTAKRIVPAALTALVLLAGIELTTDHARSSPSRCSTVVCEPCATRPTVRPPRLPQRLPRRQVAVPILMYHRINVPSPTAPEMTRRLTVHPADFARQMRWLKRHGYRTVTQGQLYDALLRGRPLGERPIMITFDDGYRDAFYKASPVLSKLGLRATAYVISGRIANGDRHFLSWGLVRALERRGIEIGSHGRPLALRRLRVLDSTGVRGLRRCLPPLNGEGGRPRDDPRAPVVG